MSETQLPWVPLISGQLSAQIDPHGAQLSALKDHEGRDLLWNGDPAVWKGRAPILFPIVGVLVGGGYRLGAATYPLPRHGFARDRIFSVDRTTAASADFSLRADEATLRVYPFHFELGVHFELTEVTLRVTSRISNKGDRDMPASFGYHPAFRWPLPFGQPRSSHFLEFENEEPAPVRRLDAEGLLTAERHPTPVKQRRLALDDALFRDDVMIFDHLESRTLTYGAAHGPRIRVDLPDAPYLGVWSKPGADFVCIEPWHGITDPEGFSGDFTEKPGVFVLKAGDSLATTMAITLLS